VSTSRRSRRTPAPKSRLKVWLTARSSVASIASSAAEPDRALINVYVALPNEKSLLKGGMFARVRLRVQRTGSRGAAISALQSEAGQSIVWIIADSKLVKRVVTVGGAMNGPQLVEM